MIKQILFDFDGVIIDSMSVRDEGFKIIAEQSTNSQKIIDEFLDYHRYNAGLSRFVKIRHLYENMLKKTITEDEINKFADTFSSLMKTKLVNEKILINETVDFIKSIYKDISLHIVSGSEEKELRYLCENLELNQFFKTIEGSPTHKNDLVKNIMNKHKYRPSETLLIGDSINDYEAAKVNSIGFYGYNNSALKSNGLGYIETFKQIDFLNNRYI